MYVCPIAGMAVAYPYMGLRRCQVQCTGSMSHWEHEVRNIVNVGTKPTESG